MERVCLIFLWLAVLFVPTHNIYSHAPGGEDPVRSLNFSRFEENGKVGLKNEAGQILIPATYDAIGWSNGKLSIVDKVVGYQSNGLWGLIHTSNKLITGAEFLELKPGEGSFLIAQKKSTLSQRPSFGVVSTSGKIIIPFQYDGLHLSNMRAVVMSRSGVRYSVGLIDLSGKVLIPLQYQRIYSLGSLRYAVENFENKMAIFSDDGIRVTDFSIDSISTFKKDYAIVYQNQRQGLMDRSGLVVLKPAYGAIQLKEDGSIKVRDMDSWFFLDGENNLANQFTADDVKSLSPDHYGVASGGKLQLTDNQFKPLSPAFFSSLSDFQNGVALYRNNGRTGMIDTGGKIRIQDEYQQLIKDQNGFLACLDIGYKNRWVILDSQGNPVTERHYEYIAPFNGKLYPVRNRGYWGAVDRNGKEIITCVHDSLVQQSGNNLVVKFKGAFGIISQHENWIVTPQANPLALLNDEAYFEFAGKTTFVKSLAGNIIYFSENRLEYQDGYLWEYLPTGAYWIIDMNGTIVDRSKQPEGVEAIFAEREGLRAIRKDGKYGFIDDAGRLRIANRYEAVKPFSKGLAAVRIRNKWGYIDHTEKLVVQPVYDQVENFNKGYIGVTQNNLSGLIDENGKIILPVRYEEVTLNSHGRFIIRQENLLGLADEKGAVNIHPRYDYLLDTGNGYVIVQRDGKFGLITLRGVSTIPMIYDALSFDPHHNQYMAVKKSDWKTVSNPRSFPNPQ